MKVTLNTQEIQEAVQCYIANVLGSELQVNDIVVVQGRDSNGSRIEVELSKFAPPIDLDDIKPVSQQTKADKLPKASLPEEESDDDTNALFKEDSEPEEIIPKPVLPEPAEVKNEPKAASVMTEGVKPLPGSFFSSN